MHVRRAAFVALIAFVITIAASAVGFAQPGPEETVATVNDDEISVQKLQAEAMARYGPQVLEHLIISTAIRQAAEEAGVEVTDEEVDKRTRSVERRVERSAPLNGVNFAKWLGSKNLTRAAFREKVRNTLLLEKMVEDQVNIPEQQVADYYSRNREKLRQPERVKIAHIVLPDAETAGDVRDKIITEKMTFEEAAAEYSLDVWTKDQGGEWGYVSEGDSKFQKTAMKLEEDGEISQAIKTPMGFHILKRLDKRPSEVPPFEDVKEEIKTQMENQKLARLTNKKRLEILKDASVERLIEFDEEGNYSLPADEAETEQ